MSEMREEMLRTLDRIVEETLTTAARETAEADGPAHAREAATAPLWTALEEAGLLAISGAGGDADVSFADAMALVRRSAYHAVPVPLGEAIAARWLATRAELNVPDGGIGMAIVEPGQRTAGGSITVTRRGDAAVLVALAGANSGEELAILAPGRALAVQSRNIAGERRESVQVPVPTAGRPIASVRRNAAAGELLAAGALLRAVQMAGAMDRALEHSLLWVNDRVQFGRPIARFQAIQHQLSILASETAAASAAVDQAVEASTAGPDAFAVAVAKARVGEAAGKVANIAHAVFGAMGFTREHQLHYTTRRLWAWRNEFGGEAYWQADLGRLAASKGGAGLWELVTARG